MLLPLLLHSCMTDRREMRVKQEKNVWGRFLFIVFKLCMQSSDEFLSLSVSAISFEGIKSIKPFMLANVN